VINDRIGPNRRNGLRGTGSASRAWSAPVQAGRHTRRGAHARRAARTPPPTIVARSGNPGFQTGCVRRTPRCVTSSSACVPVTKPRSNLPLRKDRLGWRTPSPTVRGPYARYFYIDTFDSVWGPGWKRAAAKVTHNPNGGSVSALFRRSPPPGYPSREIRPAGNGKRHRVTVIPASRR
jgi:hypothetical protein